MSEFGHAPQAEIPPQAIAPEELFDVERIRAAQINPVEPKDVIGLLDIMKPSWDPVPIFTPYGGTEIHYPARTLHTVAGEYPQARATYHPYDSLSAHEFSALRDPEGQTYLMAATVHMHEPSPDESSETLLIDRNYQAFVRKEEAQGGRKVVATIPASYEDIEAVVKAIGPPPPEAYSVPEERRLEAEKTKVLLDEYKTILDQDSDFRRAVIEYLAPEQLLSDIDGATEQRLVNEFWTGDVRNESVLFFKGDREVLVCYERNFDSVTEESYETIGILVREGATATDELPGVQEIVLSTHPRMAVTDVNVAVIQRIDDRYEEWCAPWPENPDLHATAWARSRDMQPFLGRQYPPAEVPSSGMALDQSHLHGTSVEQQSEHRNYIEPSLGREYENRDISGIGETFGLQAPKTLHPGIDMPFEAQPPVDTQDVLSPRRSRVGNVVRRFVNRLNRGEWLF